MNPETPAARLDVTTARLRFRAERGGELPEWLGSTWRGAFGRALKSLACVTGLPECSSCPMYQRCDHARIFETPIDPAAGKMRKYNAAPHPYALLPGPGGRVRRGQELEVEVRLFGRSGRDLRLVTDALRAAARGGLGPRALPLAPVASAQVATHTMDAATLAGASVPHTVRIHLITPLRLRTGGRLAGVDNLDFGGFFSVLLRRISMLCTFHQQPFETDFRALVHAAREVHWRESRLRLVRRARHSSRQKNRIDLSGLTGTLTLDGKAAAPFWPWLKIGEQTLLGRATVMGLGCYALAPSEADPAGAEGHNAE